VNYLGTKVKKGDIIRIEAPLPDENLEILSKFQELEEIKTEDDLKNYIIHCSQENMKRIGLISDISECKTLEEKARKDNDLSTNYSISGSGVVSNEELNGLNNLHKLHPQLVESDVHLVSNQSEKSLLDSANALIESNFDVVEAIMRLLPE
jgi:NACalpha-BTF3-like transcription factor